MKQWIVRYQWLLAVVLLAAVLRFWQLGQVPISPDWDEVALGYNAYSILKTGRDEYGTLLPRALRSFDDYKPPLYTYLTIPSIATFGLTVWAVRLPSVIFGVLAVLGTYFLIVELFSSHIPITNSQRRKKSLIGRTILDMSDFKNMALLGALLLAISPWHLQFSRIAFEANAGVTINIWAIYFFLRGLRSPASLLVSALLAGLGFYAYHSERIFLPLVFLVLIVLYRRGVFSHLRWMFEAAAVGLIVVLPLVPVFLDKSAWLRLSGTSSLADKTGLLMRTVEKLEDDRLAGNPWGTLFDNRRIVYAQKLAQGYLSHFSMRWLFMTGDNDRHHAPDMGLLYLVDLPFLFWGMLVASKSGMRWGKFLLAWFFLAPLAASPTTETPHAIRSLVFLPTFQIFTAIGVRQLASAIKSHVSHASREYKKYTALVLAGVLLSLFLFNVTYYLHMYFGHMNREFSRFWQYGYKEAVDYARENAEKFDKIVVSTKLEQPHMFFLFYLRYDPVKYLAQGGTASGGFAETHNKFDTYEFRPIDWDNEEKGGSILYIGTPNEITSSFVKSIYYLDGSEAMRIAY